MIPQPAAVILRQCIQVILLRRDEYAPAVCSWCVDDRHAQRLSPHFLAAASVARHRVDKTAGHENLAVVIGNAAAEALGRVDAVVGSEQTEDQAVIGPF